MAEHVLATRIQLRYDDYGSWMNSDVILKAGEAAIAIFPYQKTIYNSDDGPANTPPAVGMKIGDGSHYFRELPWVQAVAADVYSWAKDPDKPFYSASEIYGLSNYIEEYITNHGGSGSGSGTTAARIYQLIRGSNDNSNKYYLQYKEDGENQWTIDYNHYIDVNDFVKVANWIGEDVDDYESLTDRTEQHIQYHLNRLKYTDTEQSGYFVTAVSETKGKIEVFKKQLQQSDISGILDVSHGGTGKQTLNEGYALIGNGTEPVSTLMIDDTLAANNHLVTNRAIKNYIDTAVAGLEGAMHFIGDATVEPKGNVNPQVSGYNFSRAQPGDVVLWESKEYVWAGGYWRLLGDEGSYAIKGSIKNADIDPEAEIAQSKIANLAETFAGKVDKIEGKGLSSNDYTDADKLKLQNIAERAQVNVIEGITLNTILQVPDQNKIVNLSVKEFDDESRRILGTIEEGAQVNTINGITLNGTLYPPDNNQIVALTVQEFSDEYKQKLNSIQSGAQVNTIETIYLNTKQIFPDQNKRIDLSIREYPKEDEDLVKAHEQKLKLIEDGAQVNIIEHIKVDNQEIVPDQTKTVSIISDPHTEHINKIESIFINGTEQSPDNNKRVNITLDASTVNALNGAQIPPLSGIIKEDVTIIQNKLQLARIAVTADVSDLMQTANTYIILDCGTSDSDTHNT